MTPLLQLLEKINTADGCKVTPLVTPIIVDAEYELPADLRYYLEHYRSVMLFEKSMYPFTIVGVEGFKRANPVIIGDDDPDDISHHWFIIAENPSSQFITIDLRSEKAGRCYDSFWEVQASPGSQPVIASSFTGLLERLYNNKGDYLFWLKDDFEQMGDAYDE